MKILIIVVLLLSLIKAVITRNIHSDNEYTNFIELAKQYGYKSEQHSITTTDGYNINIFRIPSNSVSPAVEEKPVALLMHGFGASSNVWGFYKRSLVYYLVDAGYDVWVGNSRGNYYTQHEYLTRENSQFWNFSMNEIATMDYPATIDYILDLTNKSTLTLIAHSMGASSAILLLSERPEYNKKVNVAVTMAPPIFWSEETPVKLFMKEMYALKNLIDPNGMSQILNPNYNSFVIDDECAKYNISNICQKSFFVGYNNGSQESSVADIMSLQIQTNAGTSSKCLWHFCQCSNAGQFRKYDYGDKNIEYYNQPDPPDYNLSNIETNLILFYSVNDPFCSINDVRKIIERVSGCITINKIKYPKFSHLDFVAAKDIKPLLHDKLLKLIAKYKD